MQIVVAKSLLDPRWRDRHRTAARHRIAAIIKMSDADRAEIDRLLSDQGTITARVRKAFLDAIDRLGQQIDVQAIEALLRDGRVQEAIASVDQQLVSRGLSPIAQAVSDATIFAARSAAEALDALGQLTVSFGTMNPQTIEFLRSYEMNMIRQLSADSLASVRQVILDGISAGRNPLDIATDIRDYIGLTERQTTAVLNYRSYLTNLNSAALDLSLRDARFDPTIARAIDNAAPLSQNYINNAVDRYASRYLDYRAETIARTEALRSVNAGNDLLWRQAISDGQVDADQVTRSWVFTHDSKTRPAHRAIPDMNPDGVGMDEPFDTPDGPLMYPGDPAGSPEAVINCRCVAILRYSVSGDEA